MLFLLLCFLACLAGVEELVPAAGASAAIVAADFGMSAAIAAAARPTLSKAEVRRVADLFIEISKRWC